MHTRRNHSLQKTEINRIVNKINFHPSERIQEFLAVTPEIQAVVLMRLSKHVRFDIVHKLTDDQLLLILEILDPDEAADVIQLLVSHRQENVIQKLHDDLKDSIKLLSSFDPETAAGLMNVDYIQVEEEDTMKDVAKRFRNHEIRTGRLPVILVMREGKCIGHLPGHELGFSQPEEHIQSFVQQISTIMHNASHDEVVKVFKEFPHNKIVVIGERGNVIGIIYSDDILHVLEEQQTSSLYDFAGVSSEESVTDLVKAKVNNRYKWLIINLGTAFFASFVVGLFDETISKYVLLAIYMPIVAGMGGNAATQTLAVMVRGISSRQIDMKTGLIILKREMGAALVNGLINGVLVAIVVFLVNKDSMIALILAIAMVTNLLVAAFFGTLIPLLMKRLGKDPATSATIFITTATDVLGFLAFLTLATVLLP